MFLLDAGVPPRLREGRPERPASGVWAVLPVCAGREGSALRLQQRQAGGRPAAGNASRMDSCPIVRMVSVQAEIKRTLLLENGNDTHLPVRGRGDCPECPGFSHSFGGQRVGLREERRWDSAWVCRPRGRPGVPPPPPQTWGEPLSLRALASPSREVDGFQSTRFWVSPVTCFVAGWLTGRIVKRSPFLSVDFISCDLADPSHPFPARSVGSVGFPDSCTSLLHPHHGCKQPVACMRQRALVRVSGGEHPGCLYLNSYGFRRRSGISGSHANLIFLCVWTKCLPSQLNRIELPTAIQEGFNFSMSLATLISSWALQSLVCERSHPWRGGCAGSRVWSRGGDLLTLCSLGISASLGQCLLKLFVCFQIRCDFCC